MNKENINILIIEDDEDINRVLFDMLLNEGYMVKSAYSGTEGLIYLQENKWDIILLDLMIPGKSGEELLELIRSDFNMPVIIISAKEEQGIQAKLLRTGADDFIKKPFDLDEVLARIEANLRRYNIIYQNNNINNILQYDNIKLNTETRETTVGTIIVNLTIKEFSLLELFLRYPNKVFSKDNLYESIWGENSICDDNTISVHISNLRSKLLKAGADKEYIKTIWGIGYKFV